MRFSTYSEGGQTHFGAATDEGMIALSPDFPQWPSLMDAVRAGGLAALETAAQNKPVTHKDFTYEMVLPNAPRILCVGVNFPDRNAEYKDGSALPKYMSLFPRFASGFTGHDRPLIRPPENHTLDYEGEVAIVIGSRMMFPIRREIEYISTFMTLQPGDIIITGTPTGAGARFDPPRYLAPGDIVEVEVNGIGTLRNGIADEAP